MVSGGRWGGISVPLPAALSAILFLAWHCSDAQAGPVLYVVALYCHVQNQRTACVYLRGSMKAQPEMLLLYDMYIVMRRPRERAGIGSGPLASTASGLDVIVTT